MSSKPVLLFVITKSDLGGAQANVLDLIRGFSSQYNVHLATGASGPLADDVSLLNIPTHIIHSLTRSINLFKDWYCIKELSQLIRRIKPTLIHAHSSKAGLVARVAGHVCSIPVVFTAHGWGFSPGTPYLRRILALLAEILLAPLSARIICVSESDRQLALNRGVGNSKILNTIRYGICDSSSALADPLIQSLHLIMVARFNEQKDQPTLLKAIAQIPDFSGHIDFVGSGPSLEPCKILAKDLGISHKVTFLGDRRDVPELLSKSQIFVLATHYEGLPISILEAMRCGLPIIGSNVNGIPEEVEHGVTGLIVPPRDSSALANAIQSLVDSPKLRQTMGKAARRKFEQEFTIERMVYETGQLYEEILGSKDFAKH